MDHARSKCKCALRVVANVSNVYAVLRHRPPDGVRARGPTRTGPGIISTRIIIDDRPLRRPGAARRGAVRLSLGVSLKPDRERADTTTGGAGETGGRRAGRSGLSDGYYLSMEIDLERCQRLRSIGTARIANTDFRSIGETGRPVLIRTLS